MRKHVYINVKSRKEWYVYILRNLFAGIPHIRNTAMRIFLWKICNSRQKDEIRQELSPCTVWPCYKTLFTCVRHVKYLLHNLTYVLAMAG